MTFLNVYTNQKEEKIFHTIKDFIKSMECKIVKINASRSGIQILVLKSTGVSPTIGDCGKISKHLSVLLDVHNVMPDRNYTLEVSSPGINRPLTSSEDLVQNIGARVRIKLWRQIDECNRVKGILESVEENSLILNIDVKKETEARRLTIPFDNIQEVSLVLNMSNIFSKKNKEKKSK
jgi:ribosome maturation factor RimP